MKKTIGLVFIAAALVLSSAANADKGDWLGRARIISIDPDASSGPVTGVDVSSETTVELDFSYFVTNNLALELILGTKEHDVSLNGTNLGTVSHLPPTLTLQYHFAPQATFRPYVGVGLNYTRFYSSDLHLAGSSLHVEKDSWGGALQAGFDYQLSKNLFLNVDVKKIFIETDVLSNGAFLTNLDIDPVVFGVGLGMKF